MQETVLIPGFISWIDEIGGRKKRVKIRFFNSNQSLSAKTTLQRGVEVDSDGRIFMKGKDLGPQFPARQQLKVICEVAYIKGNPRIVSFASRQEWDAANNAARRIQRRNIKQRQINRRFPVSVYPANS